MFSPLTFPKTQCSLHSATSLACGLAFLALLFAIMLAFRPARLASVMALIFSVLAAIIATIAFAIDVALTTIAKNKVKDVTDGNLKVTVSDLIDGHMYVTEYMRVTVRSCTLDDAWCDGRSVGCYSSCLLRYLYWGQTVRHILPSFDIIRLMPPVSAAAMPRNSKHLPYMTYDSDRLKS
jgi:ABC-type transport system involved in multi-copper enzyme maturation permease subunit